MKKEGQVVTLEEINTFDGKRVAAVVAWPEKNFDQPLTLVEGTDNKGNHIKVLARSAVTMKNPRQ